MIRRPVVMIVLLASACTSSSVHRPADPGRSASSSAASPRVAAPVAFDPARAKRDVASLVAFGPRETVSPAYTRAAAFVRERFETLGYGTRMQRVTVPAGTNDGIAVAAGASVNVVAEPRAFDATRPFVVVGGHLDTVPDSPGANDNASGIAVLLELARIAAVQPPAVPVVFVAFTAEERRRTGPGSSTYARGSAAYLDSIPRAHRKNMRGGLVLDMVGAGGSLALLGRGRMVSHLLRTGRRLDIPVRRETTSYYSDHVSFVQRNYTVAWIWAGDHPTLHSPGDVATVVQPAALARAGRLAWAALRAYRP